MGELLSRLLVFQIVIDVINVTIGAGLCFGALKWRRGLLTTTAILWGFVLGCLMAIPAGDMFGEAGMLACIAIGAVIFPILTYTIPGVNRFVLGFVVSSKLLFMLTTVLAKEGVISLDAAVGLPLLGGTVVGVGLMAWTAMRVSAFVLGCTFIGASDIAPVVSEWINRILFSATGDISYLFDPVDLLFALLKVELTDLWMLVTMVVMMIWGNCKQIQGLKDRGIPLDTPLIGFEVPDKKDNGKIYVEKRLG